ncbi:hypothetical protein [Bifidobacterium sp. ESL0790]|uniref:hypothetical protein n=1 Tax=Bifidobacterium sp. ESL0790 TaxID=2983233 RepID=UPI0023F6A88A|nr:hypothetical protein [Bifidobacterium sp. ESL0790]WEV72478.1 hypothetical protein OZY47_00325 [Bifidobacterium sp. ESL0790]
MDSSELREDDQAAFHKGFARFATLSERLANALCTLSEHFSSANIRPANITANRNGNPYIFLGRNSTVFLHSTMPLTSIARLISCGYQRRQILDEPPKGNATETLLKYDVTMQKTQ